MAWVFKIVRRDVFEGWASTEPWSGTDKDRSDGFIHLSAGDQLSGTLDKHYSGVDELLLLWLPTEALPTEQLRWEPSRGGALFPHLYGPLQKGWVARVDLLPIVDGRHQLPADLS